MRVSFKEGALVVADDQLATVLLPAGDSSVFVKSDKTGNIFEADVSSIKARGNEKATPKKAIRNFDLLTESERQDVLKWVKWFEPFAKGVKHGAHGGLIKDIARKSGKSGKTVQRKLKIWEDTGDACLLVDGRKGRVMPSRLTPEQTAIIDKAITDDYLNLKKRSLKYLVTTVRIRCSQAKIALPSREAIRKRLASIPEKEVSLKREGKKMAHDKFGSAAGSFPGADFPLAVVQVDHTLLDIELVDDWDRKTIGRPYLTVAIDTYSRMVTGFYISLDAPSAHSVGLCLTHAALSKEPELANFDVIGKWPIWGMPQRIHVDSGKEFHSKTLEESLLRYGVEITYRPVRTPHFGGHIERLIGNLNNFIHDLPGSTFSNPKAKGITDPQKTAALTLSELRRLLIQYISGIYHIRTHSSLGVSPLEMWRRGTLGYGTAKGCGLPEKISDERRLKIDFLPSTERTVTREGIQWDNVKYYSHVLDSWINSGRKFLVRRDPSDISKIYFLDPSDQHYHEIEYSHLGNPSVTLWELRRARKLVGHDEAKITEAAIMEMVMKMRVQIACSEDLTKKVRRNRQKAFNKPVSIASEEKNTSTKQRVPPPKDGAALANHIHLGGVSRPKEDDYDLTDADLEGVVRPW